MSITNWFNKSTTGNTTNANCTSTIAGISQQDIDNLNSQLLSQNLYTTTMPYTTGTGSYTTNTVTLPNSFGSRLSNKQIQIKETANSILFLFTEWDGTPIFYKLCKNELNFTNINKEWAKAILHDREEEYLALRKLKA